TGHPELLVHPEYRRILFAQHEPEPKPGDPFAVSEVSDDLVRRPLSFERPRAQYGGRMRADDVGQRRRRLRQNVQWVAVASALEQILAIRLWVGDGQSRLRHGHGDVLSRSIPPS